MDIKEKRKQYHINNREKIWEKCKIYYKENKEQRQIYNNEYWSLNGHKYIEKRSKDNEYKSKQREYYKKYRERPKHIYQNNVFQAPSKKDFIVSFSF